MGHHLVDTFGIRREAPEMSNVAENFLCTSLKRRCALPERGGGCDSGVPSQWSSTPARERVFPQGQQNQTSRHP